MKAMYSIYDHGADTWNDPFCARADGEARRIFTQLVNDPQTTISQFPKDYTLYRVGHFNEDSGVLVVEEHKSLNAGPQLVREASDA